MCEGFYPASSIRDLDWFPKWRSPKLGKGHLKPPKRSLGRTWMSVFFLAFKTVKLETFVIYLVVEPPSWWSKWISSPNKGYTHKTNLSCHHPAIFMEVTSHVLIEHSSNKKHLRVWIDDTLTPETVETIIKPPRPQKQGPQTWATWPSVARWSSQYGQLHRLGKAQNQGLLCPTDPRMSMYAIYLPLHLSSFVGYMYSRSIYLPYIGNSLKLPGNFL